MSPCRFDQFFQCALGSRVVPFDYQRRLACGERNGRSEKEWLQSGSECKSRLINIPTGCGKTAAAVLAWLWNRVGHADDKHRATWPRRLVYCLPMRTLVEQTEREIGKWLTNLWDEADSLGLSGDASRELEWLVKHSPIILMGGEETDFEWDVWPEKSAILIGTQDMLLSRALNRGYAMSRYRWPMHFGLLNNDCLWVMDETQLMGVGVETSSQLDGFRHGENIGARPCCRTWWMSATLDEARLETVDHPRPNGGWPTVRLGEADLTLPAVRDRYTAQKKISNAPFALDAVSRAEYAKSLARFIAEQHQRNPNELTLVVLNNVKRAQNIFAQLKKLRAAQRMALIHSRFRSPDREAHEKILHSSGGRIVVTTQAVEAGVDVSARTLITELAPWSSLVQRFGRCNRYGEFTEGAEIFWIDIKPRDNKDDLALPYLFDELKTARELLGKLGGDAGPRPLREKIDFTPPTEIRPVIRRKDLFDLFDTTPDICGNDLDISRYVRDGDDTDVRVYWREVRERAVPADNEPRPLTNELCAVSLRAFGAFLQKKKPRVFWWNPVEEKWDEPKRARPGQIYLLAREAGGYSDTLGWTGNPKDNEMSISPPSQRELRDGNSRDPDSFTGRFVLLDEHTCDVVEEVEKLIAALALDNPISAALHTAAHWHDVGKAHEEFQEMLHAGAPSDYAAKLLAKSKNQNARCARRFFRHELASALAWLQNAPDDAANRDLVAFLIAAHHGKVRLSIRSFPTETPPPEPERLYARGIWDGDPLPGPRFESFPVNGQTIARFPLDLGVMQLGDGPRGPSWLARMVTLRDTLGPFHLAWLETLLRAADMRASGREQQSRVT